MSIKAVFWDFSGVLITEKQGRGHAYFSQMLGIPADVLKAYFFSEENHKKDLGEISYIDFYRLILHEQNKDEVLLSNISRAFEEAFELNQPMLEYIKELSKSVKIGLLSNYSDRLRPMLEKDLHIAHLFHDIVISSEVGMVKPDEQIYHTALSRLNVFPHEAIFVDDRIENIEGAARVSIHAIHFQNNEQTISKIDQLIMEN